MLSQVDKKRPRWVSDLLRFLPLKSQFVLSGNVRDLQIEYKSESAVFQPLNYCLNRELQSVGYEHVLCYDFINGFKLIDPSNNSHKSEEIENLMKKLGVLSVDGNAPAGIKTFASALEKIISWREKPIALIVDFASRLRNNQNQLSECEHHFFTRALIRSHEAKPYPHGSTSKPFYNTILWVVDREGDMPDWMTVNNTQIRHISIPSPDNHIRHSMATSLLQSFDNASAKANPQSIEIAIQNFVDNTDGLLLVELKLIAQLCKEEGLGYANIAEAVRRYKVGVSEDPWQKIDRRKISEGEDSIGRRVKGQEHAVVHMLDIVKRAVTGVGSSRRGGRPRGIAFLAGPTGVGKTELAKSITSLLFGDENAYIRFDMSEFSAEHSDQRLIGAPPGYVGYDMGGELTNAIRQKPFSVVLFDEIEKAHPRILDKFLQILDDGVLTSGRGERVYFTEALIIFTSNLGIYRTDAHGNKKETVSSTDSFEDIQKRIREEIEQHFKLTLNRPEILNRMGDNIIVFDFIRKEVAEKILESMIKNVLNDLEEAQNIKVTIDSLSQDMLQILCLQDLSNGGRGIRNKIETHLVNPLSRALFDENITSGSQLRISNIETTPVTKLCLTKIP